MDNSTAAAEAAELAQEPQIEPRDPRPVVAIDVDEVLGAFVEALCAFTSSREGAEALVAASACAGSAEAGSSATVSTRVSFTPSDFMSYDFATVWRCSLANASVVVAAFLRSPFFLELRPLAGAREVLLRHVGRLRFVVVTSRSIDIAKETRAWLDRHFEGCFDGALFGNAYGRFAKRNKSELCRQVGAVALVEDNAAYAFEAATAVKKVYLFGHYAWNTTGATPLPPNVKRVADWETLDGLLASLPV